jgi:hypothetical protein
MEIPPPQPKFKAYPNQLEETQTSQERASTRKGKIIIVVSKSPIERKRRRGWKIQPEEI